MKMCRSTEDSAPEVPRAAASDLLSVSFEELKDIIREAVSEALRPLIEKLNSLETSIDALQKESLIVKNMASTTGISATKNKSKIRSVRKEQRTLENQLIRLQMDKVKYSIRLQSVAEEENEDLREKISELLAPLTGRSKEEFLSETEEIYRVSSAYIRRNALPREIHLKFTSKKLRDIILQKTNEKPLEIDGEKVKILKDIPFLVRQRRRQYKQLSTLLIKKDIKFRWLIPEGLSFKYKGQFVKLTSEEKLKDFMLKYKDDLGPHQEPEMDNSSSGEDGRGEDGFGAGGGAGEKMILRSKS